MITCFEYQGYRWTRDRQWTGKQDRRPASLEMVVIRNDRLYYPDGTSREFTDLNIWATPRIFGRWIDLGLPDPRKLKLVEFSDIDILKMMAATQCHAADPNDLETLWVIASLIETAVDSCEDVRMAS